MMASLVLGQAIPPGTSFDGVVWIVVGSLEDLAKPSTLAWVRSAVLPRRVPGAVIEIRFWTRVGP
jgi:hypothetical protein